MIDNNKLLNKNKMETGRNIVTVKKNLVKIDSILKERLILTKTRNVLMRQMNENRMRKDREDDLENLKRDKDGDQDNKDKKDGGFLSGLISAIATISAAFLPQLLKIFNFLRRVAEPVKKMIDAIIYTLSTFFKVVTDGIEKIKGAWKFTGDKLSELSPKKIQTAFALFSERLTNFVNVLVLNSVLNTVNSVLSVLLPQKVKQIIMKEVAQDLTQKSGKKIAQKSFSFVDEQIKAQKVIAGESTLTAKVDPSQSDFASRNRLGLGDDGRKIVKKDQRDISKNILKENIDPKNLKNALSESNKMGKMLLRETEMIVDANGKIFFLGIGNNKIPLTGEVFQEQFGKDTFFFADASPSNFQLINDVRGKRGLLPLERSFDISQDLKSAGELAPKKLNFLQRIRKFDEGIAEGGESFAKKIITKGPLRGIPVLSKGIFRNAIRESIGFVPFLGELVGLLLDIYLFGEVPKRAGYKTIGSIILGFLFALIGAAVAGPPGALIGNILGGIGGDLLGGFIYDITEGRKTDASRAITSTTKKPVSKSFFNLFNTGGYTGTRGGIVHANEFVIDADSTLAIRQNAPGFLEALNSAYGFESLNVLRDYASYEGTQSQIAYKVIMSPLPKLPEDSSSSNFIVQNQVKSNISSHHYRRGA